MIRTIDGKTYLLRYQRPVAELRRLHRDFCAKFRSTIGIHRWLVEYGKVHKVVSKTKER